MLIRRESDIIYFYLHFKEMALCSRYGLGTLIFIIVTIYRHLKKPNKTYFYLPHILRGLLPTLGSILFQYYC